jgi:hypothetical protein
MDWPKLHDASLAGIQLQWQEGTVAVDVIYFASGTLWKGRIRGIGLSRFNCSRTFPWGESQSINEVSLNPIERCSTLTIEMQSGDEITIHANSFCFDKGAAT